MRTRTSRVGQSVGGFQLVERVSDGAQASVYRGQSTAGEAAVKIYEAGAPHLRVRREVGVQQQVNHPCVARFLGSGALPDGGLYLASAWVAGQRLEDRLPMDWHELAPIVRAIGRGLSAIHAAGVVHRDLKPANVMLPSGGEPAAVVLDFGHSLLLDEKRLTETGQVLGTASYSAPEQAAGRPIDGRADLYALGVIVYRALTGVLPFEDPSPAEVLRMHVAEPVIPPGRRAPSRRIPRAAEDLCLWLLAKEPQARVPNTRVLAITLQGLSDELESVA